MPSIPALAAILVLLALVIGAFGLHAALAAQNRALRPVVGRGPVAGIDPGFFAFVHGLVPQHDPVRVVLPVLPQRLVSPPLRGQPGTAGVCGHYVSTGHYWWVVYALVPRPSTCDPGARWSVYVGVPPATGSGRVYRYDARLSVVRR